MRGLWIAALVSALVGCKGAREVGPSAPAQPASGAVTGPSAPASAASAAGSVAVAPSAAPPRIRPDWRAMRVADEGCADCHPDEVEAWATSKMGRSFSVVDPAAHAPLAVPDERVHPVSGLRYIQAGGRFTEQAGAETFERTARFVVGSGAHAHSYLWADDHQIFELPLTWYTPKKAWDFSPGYTAAAHPGSFRAVPEGCVLCHADPVPARAGTKTYFEQLPDRPFGCTRCHGDGAAHAAARLDGKDAPIVSPGTLTPERANDVCAFCHFPGAARLLRADRRWADFVPGQPLEDTVAVFVREQATEGFGTTSHHHRLAMSACSRGTPGLTCTTCHSPHPTGPARDRSAACRDCHGGSGAAKGHACAGPGGDDCAQCHMDFGRAQNIPHVSATDHFIRARPEAKPPKNNDSALRWVAHPEAAPTDPDHQILLGRAYVEAWRADGQARDAQRAEMWLARGVEARPDRVDAWLELATLRRLTGNRAGERAAAERAFALAPSDRRVALLVGGARLQARDATGALEALDRAATAGDSAEIQTLRARALQALARGPAARAAAKRAAALQPTSAEAWLAVGLLAVGASDLEAAQAALETAAAWGPKDLRAWLHLGRVTAARGQWARSAEAYAAAVAQAGEDPDAVIAARLGRMRALVALREFTQARAIGVALLATGKPLPGLPTMMAQVHLAAGELEPALHAIDASTHFSPQDPETWTVRAAVLEARGDAEGAAAARAKAAGLQAGRGGLSPR